MTIIAPKNWNEFQHYKDRSPDWIKLHRRLLDDFEFHSLPVEARALAPMLWLLASDDINGTIDANLDKLSFRLRMDKAELGPAIEALLEAGFFEITDEKPVAATSAAAREKSGFSSRHISDKTKREVWERDGGVCQISGCGSSDNLEYDHKIPVSKGGTSTAENVWLLCRSHNRAKRAKSAEQFATQAQPLRSLEREVEKQVKTEKQVRQMARSADADEIAPAFHAYNAVAEETGWPKAQALTPKRRAALKARIFEAGGIAGWHEAMAKARGSPFLRGERGRDKTHENWTPDLDFFLQQSTFTKLMEGKYDDRASNQAPTGFSALIAGARAAAAG